MSDPWDEMPNEKNEKYKDRFYEDFYRFKYDNYIDDLYGWLAQLRARYYIMETRLEGVENWLKELEEITPLYYIPDAGIAKLKDILDLSEFKENSE